MESSTQTHHQKGLKRDRKVYEPSRFNLDDQGKCQPESRRRSSLIAEKVKHEKLNKTTTHGTNNLKQGVRKLKNRLPASGPFTFVLGCCPTSRKLFPTLRRSSGSQGRRSSQATGTSPSLDQGGYRDMHKAEKIDWSAKGEVILKIRKLLQPHFCQRPSLSIRKEGLRIKKWTLSSHPVQKRKEVPHAIGNDALHSAKLDLRSGWIEK